MGNRHLTPSTSACSPPSSPNLHPENERQKIKDIQNCSPQLFQHDPIFQKEESFIIQSTGGFATEDSLDLTQYKSLRVLLREVPVICKMLFRFQRIIENSINILSLSIELHECEIGDIEVSLLLVNINKMQRIQHLNLNLQYNKITSEGSLTCMSYISQVPSIVSLAVDFRGNKFNGKLDKCILSKYMAKMEHLECLHLNISLCGMLGEEAIQYSESLKQLRNLTSLTFDISENSLKDDYILEVVGMNICKISSLSNLSLDISANRLSDQCVGILFEEIAQLTQLIKLEIDLTETKQLSSSLTEMAPNALKQLTKLKELRIETNSPGCVLEELFKVAKCNSIKILSSEYCGGEEQPPENQ